MKSAFNITSISQDILFQLSGSQAVLQESQSTTNKSGQADVLLDNFLAANMRHGKPSSIVVAVRTIHGSVGIAVLGSSF